MLRKPKSNTLLPIATLGVFILLAGCASRPKYGAAPKHKHGCDCPKWNAVPMNTGKDVRVGLNAGTNDLVAAIDHDTID